MVFGLASQWFAGEYASSTIIYTVCITENGIGLK